VHATNNFLSIRYDEEEFRKVGPSLGLAAYEEDLGSRNGRRKPLRLMLLCLPLAGRRHRSRIVQPEEERRVEPHGAQDKP
jgi:hypothetical protein